jgi:hypothetical protein
MQCPTSFAEAIEQARRGECAGAGTELERELGRDPEAGKTGQLVRRLASSSGGTPVALPSSSLPPLP